LQGRTIHQKVIIHDVFEAFADNRWFWTAMTRTTSLDDITINLYKKSKKSTGYNFNSTILSHKEADKKSNRFINDYITVEWIEAQLKAQNGCCTHCDCLLNKEHIQRDPLNISIDRIDNNMAHNKDNCVLSCNRCNITKK